MNADPRVMEYFPELLSKEASDATVGRINAHFEAHGFSLWALEIPGQAPFIGFTGLLRPNFETHFTPCVEIGWRLDATYWNRGFASEAAERALDFAFDDLGLDEVVAMTVPTNLRSRRVMEKLGMRYDPADDFDHPRVPAHSPLYRHVLYRLKRADWNGGANRQER